MGFEYRFWENNSIFGLWSDRLFDGLGWAGRIDLETPEG
jgi:hypothetical protein